MSETNEQRWSDLMIKSQGGDQAAYRTLLTELVPLIRKYCSNRVGYLDLAEDATQESLLAIHKYRHTFDPKRPFLPWVFSIARNRMIDCIRKKKSVLNWEEGSDELLAEASEAVPDSSQVFSNEQLKSVLDTLPAKYRNPIVMLKLQGRTTKEVAGMLQVSESAIKMRVSRGFEMLRGKLERKIDDE